MALTVLRVPYSLDSGHPNVISQLRRTDIWNPKTQVIKVQRPPADTESNFAIVTMVNAEQAAYVPDPIPETLNLRKTTSQKCEAVPRRARI